MKSYIETSGRNPDFKVKYRLYSREEGGRKVTFQHLRCDFAYEGQDVEKDGIYMIHPEFLDKQDKPIEERVLIPLEGNANMWIIVPEMRTHHKDKIRIGIKGFFMEGRRRIGEVEIIEIKEIKNV